MKGQMTIFDFLVDQNESLMPDGDGKISKELLKPVRWKAFKLRNEELRLNDDVYEISAFVGIMPNNYMYVKDWMLYPFMTKMKDGMECDKVFNETVDKIGKFEYGKTESVSKWEIFEMPELEDMYEYEKGKLSCYQYAMRQKGEYVYEKSI